jgi:hypothetical protein
MQFPDEQRHVERNSVEQEPLENVLATAEMDSPHSPGLVHMGKAAFDMFWAVGREWLA